MSDQPLTLGNLATALAQFHREIVRPDTERLLEDMFERRIKPRFDEINGHFDAIYHWLTNLETEYQMAKVALTRMDGRLDVLDQSYKDLLAAMTRLEEGLSRVERTVDTIPAVAEQDPLRAEVSELRGRVDDLHGQVRSLEERVARE